MEHLSEFAKRINPHNFNFSPKLIALVGAVIGEDYGVRDRKGGHITSLSITSDGYVIGASTASDGGGAFVGRADEMEQNLKLWKAELSADDLKEFDAIYAKRVTDWRA